MYYVVYQYHLHFVTYCMLINTGNTLKTKVISYLHNSGVLPDPVVQGAGKLFQLFESPLGLGIEQGMAGRWLGEHVVELGHVGDNRLLVRFGGIDI